MRQSESVCGIAGALDLRAGLGSGERLVSAMTELQSGSGDDPILHAAQSLCDTGGLVVAVIGARDARRRDCLG